VERLAVVVVVVASLVIGVAPAWAAVPSHKTKLPKLKPMLLTVEQMPTGWSQGGSGTGGGIGCLTHIFEPKGIRKTGSASVTYAANAGLPQVTEELATYSGPAKTAFQGIDATLRACKTVKGSSGGSKATGTVGEMSFPKMGDQSAAFEVQLTISGTSANQDVVIARKGSIILGLTDGTLGTPSLTEFEHFAQLALAKVK